MLTALLQPRRLVRLRAGRHCAARIDVTAALDARERNERVSHEKILRENVCANFRGIPA